MIKTHCITCGNEFHTWPHVIRAGKGLYCSRDCMWQNVSRKRESNKVPCQVCGTLFSPFPSVLNNKRRFCSLLCFGKASRSRIEKNCPLCGKIFFAILSDIKDGHGNYCSHTCRARAQAKAPIVRLLNKIIILPGPNACWIWTGPCTGNGYGHFKISNKSVIVTHFSYEYFRGPIGDRFVLHYCDIPLCANPSHLFLGTQLDNMRDMVQKGRKVAHSSLQEGEVEEIRLRRKNGEKVKDLAKIFNVHRTTITNIYHSHTWGGMMKRKHIPRPAPIDQS